VTAVIHGPRVPETDEYRAEVERLKLDPRIRDMAAHMGGAVLDDGADLVVADWEWRRRGGEKVSIGAARDAVVEVQREIGEQGTP
jgi:hypothetical protein